jgi:hypothetical protein
VRISADSADERIDEFSAGGAPSTTSTSLSGGGQSGASISVPESTAVTDTATLSGTNASTATGTVTYSVYSDSGCTTAVSTGTAQSITAPGTLPASSPVTLSTPGTYYWQASYSGDAANTASMSTCGSEVVIVGAPAAPTAVKAVSGSTTAATGSLIVTFTLGADNGSAVTSQTAKCTSSNGGVTETGTHSGASAAAITVASVTTGKTYTCTVTATNARGASLASAPSLPVIVG